MLEKIRDLQSIIDELYSLIRKVKTKQISNKSIINKCKSIVDYYFRDVRTLLSNIEVNRLHEFDSNMQSLLDATHKNTSVNVYKNIVKSLQGDLFDIEKLSLIGMAESDSIINFDENDKKILKTLKNLLPSAALSYEQALIDIQNDNRISWRGPATDLRESLRECLDHLAPDSDVISQPNFELDPNTNRPTMKQKVRFILKNRKMSPSKMKPTEDAVNIVEQSLGGFVRSVYKRASVSTHTPTERSEVIRIKEYVRIAFLEILALE